MKTNPTYKNLSIHQKINTRSGVKVDRKTGKTPSSKVGRFEHQLNLNFMCEDSSHNQPLYLRKHVVHEKEFIIKHDIKF